MKQKNNIVISAGGTGGHVFPALVLAKGIVKKHNNCSCYFFTDTRVFSSNKFDFSVFKKVFKLQGAGIVNLSLIKKLFNAFKLSIGFVQSLYYLFKLKPKLIVAFGGYITLPVAIAGYVLKIPIVIHEQNKIPSSTNVLLAKIASLVAVSFKDTKNLNGKNVFYTGMPVRDTFFTENPTEQTVNNKITFAFLGGSLGSSVFGLNVAKAFTMLSEEMQKKCIVYHQCREELEQEAKKLWQQTSVDFKVKPFFKNIDEVMKLSNVIFTRSGASTVFEVMALNKHAIFVPFEGAANSHQYHNAMSLVKENLAEICLEKNFTSNYIHGKLEYVFKNIENIKQKNNNNSFKVNGALELVKLCEKYIKR